jgi:tetratricopeptide (TPR) repeat protein
LISVGTPIFIAQRLLASLYRKPLTGIQRHRDYCPIVRKAVARLAIVSALAVLAAFRLPAENRALLPAPHPLAVRLAASAEPLSLDELVDASLVFSGVPDSSLPAYRRKLLDLVAGFQQQAAAVSDPAILGARILEYLHTGPLRRYEHLQARVDVLLDEGTFNCVSSAVVYVILARSVGLVVGGVRTPDHAFCTLTAGTTTIDVETTNRYGFDPGTRKEFTDSFGRVTGFAYTPPANYRDRTPIGERGLLSLILYDRVSFATVRGDHASARGSAITAWTLAGDGLTRSTLVTALSNYAIGLSQARRFDEAVAFLEESERAFGADAELARLRRDFLHNQAVALMESGDLVGAEALLASRSVAGVLDPSDRRGLLRDLAVSRMNAGELDAAEALLTTGPLADAFDPADRRELLVGIIELRADRSAQKGEFVAAARLIADGISRMGSEPDLLEAYEMYTHNAAAVLFNARRFREAKTFLEAALARYPGSRMIRQDLEDVVKAMKR